MSLRPINRIAAEILTVWGTNCRNPTLAPNFQIYCLPYVDAMLELKTVQDKYGFEDGESIVLRFLSNATPWRGPYAKKIKKELNDHIKAKSL